MDSTVDSLNLILPIWSSNYGIQSLSSLPPLQLQQLYQATSTSTRLELLSYINTQLSTELTQTHDSIILTYQKQRMELAITHHLKLGNLMTLMSYMIPKDQTITRVILSQSNVLTFE